MRDESQTECLPLTGGIGCQEAELLVSRRLDGELDEADASALDAHLLICPKCRAFLQDWNEQGEALKESLESLWNKSEPAANRPMDHKVIRAPRGVWLPMGMAASQVLALVGLSIYFVFFGSPASAPQVSQSQPEPAPKTATPAPPAPCQAGEPIELALPKNTPVEPLDVEIVMSSHYDQVQVSVEKVPAQADPARPPKEIVMAAPQSANPLVVISDISLSYRLAGDPLCVSPLSRGRELNEQSGRIVLLGDILHGRGAVRIVDSAGKTQEIAQADLDTLLRAPLREIVRSFIRECARPDVRVRLLSAQDRGE